MRRVRLAVAIVIAGAVGGLLLAGARVLAAGLIPPVAALVLVVVGGPVSLRAKTVLAAALATVWFLTVGLVGFGPWSGSVPGGGAGYFVLGDVSMLRLVAFGGFVLCLLGALAGGLLRVVIYDEDGVP